MHWSQVDQYNWNTVALYCFISKLLFLVRSPFLPRTWSHSHYLLLLAIREAELNQWNMCHLMWQMLYLSLHPLLITQSLIYSKTNHDQLPKLLPTLNIPLPTQQFRPSADPLSVCLSQHTSTPTRQFRPLPSASVSLHRLSPQLFLTSTIYTYCTPTLFFPKVYVSP